MKVSDFMTRNVKITAPHDSLRQAAQEMLQVDIGALPVCENGRIVGMITDRDIAVRAVALGKGPEATVGEIMTREVKFCREDDDAMVLADAMAREQVRRLIVLNQKKRLVGIVSLADFATDQEPDISGATLRGISQPGGAHCQSAETHRAA